VVFKRCEPIWRTSRSLPAMFVSVGRIPIRLTRSLRQWRSIYRRIAYARTIGRRIGRVISSIRKMDLACRKAGVFPVDSPSLLPAEIKGSIQIADHGILGDQIRSLLDSLKNRILRCAPARDNVGHRSSDNRGGLLRSDNIRPRKTYLICAIIPIEQKRSPAKSGRRT